MPTQDNTFSFQTWQLQLANVKMKWDEMKWNEMKASWIEMVGEKRKDDFIGH